MWSQIVEYTKYFIRATIDLDNDALVLNHTGVSIILIHYALLNISYLPNKGIAIIRLMTTMVRPQTFINGINLEIFAICLCVVYVIQIVIRLPGRKQIALISQLTGLGLLNILFETSQGWVGRILLIIVELWRYVIISGKLDIRVINFQTIKSSWLGIALKLLAITQMIVYIYVSNHNNTLLIALSGFSSCLIIIDQLYNQPIKNINIITIIISIQVCTLFYITLVISDLMTEYDSDILIIPFIYKIIHRIVRYKQYSSLFILIDQSNSIIKDDWNIRVNRYCQEFNSFDNVDDVMVYGSILLYTDKQYEAYQILLCVLYYRQYLKYTYKYSILTECKLSQLLNNCIIQIQENIECHINGWDRMDHSAKLLLNNEHQYIKIRQQVIDVIKLKIDYYTNVLDRYEYQGTITMLNKMISLQQQLLLMHREFPTVKTQALLAFFYAEVLNDYLSASQLYNMKQQHKNTAYDLVNDKAIYLIVDFDDELIVKQASNNAASFFNTTVAKLIDHTVDHLIPPGIQEQHTKLLKVLFETGQSKYYRRFNTNLIYNEVNQSISNVELAFDLHFINDGINAVAFFRSNTVSHDLCMILNANRQVSAVSESLAKILKINTLIGLQIESLIPTLVSRLNNKVEHQQLNNLEIIVSSNIDGDTLSNRVYSTSLSLNVKIVQGIPLYYILYFEYVKSIISYQSLTRLQNTLLVNEEIIVNQPYTDMSYAILDKYSHEYYQMEHTGTIYQQHYFNDNRNISLSSASSVNLQPSEGSSIQQRKSKYKSKYDLITIMSGVLNKKQQQTTHLRFMTVSSLSIIMLILLTSIQLAITSNRSKQLIWDIDLLQIKNLVFQPIDSFQLTRWTLFDYGLMLESKIITIGQYLEDIKFPQQNLAQGYDRLYENIQYILNRQQLQSLIDETQVTIIINHNITFGQEYDVPIRNAMNILLNYQYSLKMAYIIDGKPDIESPAIFYTYRNYKPLKSKFSQLNEQILQLTVDQSLLDMQIVTIIFIVTITIFVLLQIVSYYSLFKISEQLCRYTKILQQCDRQHIFQEINRYVQTVQLLESKQIHMSQYVFNIIKAEQGLNQAESSAVGSKLVSSRYNRRSIFPRFSIFIAVVLAIGLINSITTYSQFDTFVSRFIVTSYYYKEMSDVGTDVPTMYAQREVWYGSYLLPSLNQTDKDDLVIEVQDCLVRIKQFMQFLVHPSTTALLSDEFRKTLVYIEQGDLCQYLGNEMLIKAEIICPLAFNQNMQLGLSSILTFMINDIQGDLNGMGFISRVMQDDMKLEGAFLVSEVMRELNHEFRLDLWDQTYQLIAFLIVRYYTNQVQNSLVICILVLCLMYLFQRIHKQLVKEYKTVIQIIYLMPRWSIYSDPQFERALRRLYTLDLY